jgi:hypothetical protein
VTRKRGPQKRTIDRAQAGLLDFFKAAGMEVSEEDVKAAYEVKYNPHEHPDSRMLQAEGMLLHLRTAAKQFMAKKCLECEEVFSTNYIGVAYCSDLCRGKAIEKQMGIRWDYEKDHYENLSAERPLIVSPPAYQVLLEWARRVLELDGLVVQESPANPMPPESDEEQNPNSSVPDTNPEPSLPQLTSVSPGGLFGPAPF